MSGYVGADHQFQDYEFARAWAQRFTPTPERLALFATIADRLEALTLPCEHLVELGVGPGYLAEYLPDITYEGVDFSPPMIDLAAARLSSHQARLYLTRADLLAPDWAQAVSVKPGAIITTWTLHDLGGKEQTRQVYETCRSLLPSGGVFLNGDFVKPEGATQRFEPGRFPVARHLELLRSAGFREARCLLRLETEIANPTPAQNYVCLEALA